MKIISCHIDAFGKFKNADFDFNQGTNILCEKNGFGKTTLAEFIKAMFYSMPASSKKSGVKSLRDFYRPFNFEGKYGGRLKFSCKKGEFVVVRQFGTTPTLDKFFLFDAKTNLTSYEFSSNLGEELFGVGRETFENTTFFGQQQLASAINDELRANLATGVLSGDDVDNFEKAQIKLEKRQKELRTENRSLKLEELKAENERLQAREEHLKTLIKNTESDIKSLSKTEQELSKQGGKNDEKEIMTFKNKKFALKSVIEIDNQRIVEKQNQKQNLEKQFELTQEEISFLKNNDKIQKGHKASAVSMWLIGFVLVGLLLVLCGGVLRINPLFIAGACVSVIFLICSITSFFIYFSCYQDLKKYKEILKKHNTNSKSLAEKIKIYDSISVDLRFFEEEISKLEEEVNNNKVALENLENQFLNKFGYKIDDFDLNNSSRNRKINDIEKQIVELFTDKKHYLEDLNEVEDKIFELEEQISSSLEKFEENQRKMDILSNVASYLEKSRDAISNRYIEPVSGRFNKYYKELLEDGEEIVIDTNLGMKFGDNFSSVEHLSAGLLDLVYVCKRFALADLIFKKEKPMLILDDPFANFDDEKLSLAKKVLSELEENYQIVLFTCQKARS